MRRSLLVGAVLALSVGGCGQDQAGAGKGSGSPAAAVEQFAQAAGHPGRDPKQTKLVKACRLLSPDVRGGIRFQSSTQPSDRDCAAALSLALFYPGDSGELPDPRSLAVEVGDVSTKGRRAVVHASVTFGTDQGRRTYRTEVLAVRGADGWRVATPDTLGILAASEGVDDAVLFERYNKLRQAAGHARVQYAEGRAASSTLGTGSRPCRGEPASRATDPSRDVVASDGAKPLRAAPAGTDLSAARHVREGDELCFELTYRGPAAAKGSATVRVRPTGREVSVLWDAGEGRISAQTTDSNDEAHALPVTGSRTGRTVVFRVPRDRLAPQTTYAWSVQSFVSRPHEHDAYLDRVPGGLDLRPTDDAAVRHPPR